MNKRYCIDVKEVPTENKKKELVKSSDYSFLILLIAIIIGVIISPDLVDVTDYIPKDKVVNSYTLRDK